LSESVFRTEISLYVADFVLRQSETVFDTVRTLLLPSTACGRRLLSTLQSCNWNISGNVWNDK